MIEERISSKFSEIVPLLLIKPLPTTAISIPQSATIFALCDLIPPSIISNVSLPPLVFCSSIAERSTIPAIIESTNSHLQMIGSRFDDKAKKFSSLLNMEIKSVSVRDTRTRWGSCSSSGNLSFCWRLIFAPEKIVDYVCAHEAAHLVELNHSPRFWQTVYQLVGEWKSSKKWLKENGARLHRYG